MQSAPPWPASTRWWQSWSSELLLCWQLWLGAYPVVFIFLFFSWLCCPLRFHNSPQTCLWEGFLLFGNFSSFRTPSPGGISIPNSFVSIFVFYILPYLLSKRMGCLSGCLVSSTSIQKLFCGSCSAFKWSFDEFVGGKVVSQSYSSAIFKHASCSELFSSLFLVTKITSQYLTVIYWLFSNRVKFLCVFFCCFSPSYTY